LESRDRYTSSCPDDDDETGSYTTFAINIISLDGVTDEEIDV